MDELWDLSFVFNILGVWLWWQVLSPEPSPGNAGSQGLEKKSWWILECPEAPPLRLIHWSKIAAAGQLPKYNDPGSATSVEVLLDEVEDAKLRATKGIDCPEIVVVT